MSKILEFDYRNRHYIFPYKRGDLDALEECKEGDMVSFVDFYGFGKFFKHDEIKNVNVSEIG